MTDRPLSHSRARVVGSAQPESRPGRGDLGSPPGSSATGSASGSSAAGSPSGSSAVSADDELTVISTRGPLTEPAGGPLLPPLEVGKMLEGERLGQFVLQKYVGGGGMGVVFRALDTTLNRDVAVKVLARSQSQDEETLRRFKNEAQSAARLDHDNIARVFYVGEDRGVHYIVFEFIDGENIRDLVQQIGPLPLADAISYTLQVAEALSHASQRDVIHRDIKPSNVLITPDGKAKLVDMGLARLHQVEHADNDLTASGVTLGTFDYISPEQARDPRSADVRSDLYSLGCSFYYMLTGRPPFPEGTVLQKLLQHQGDDPPDPRTFRPDLPVEATQILTRLLAKNPLRRYQTPAELIGELGGLAERAGMPTAPFAASLWAPPARPRPPAAWQAHLPWLVPVAALVLIVAGLDYRWSRAPGAYEPLDAETATASETLSSEPAASPFSATRVRQPAVAAPSAGDRAPLRPGSTPPGPQAPAGALPAASSAHPIRSWDALGLWAARWPRLFWQGELAWPEWQAEASAVPRDVGELGPPTDDAQGGIAVTGDKSRPGPAAIGSSPVAGPAATDTRPREGWLVVTPDQQGEGFYASLDAAASAAHSGDVIELRYQGRRDARPIVVANKSLVIRAGEGWQPVVVFRPGAADSIAYPRSMITVAGGQLTLSGVHLELEVPREVSAEAWTLIETRRAELVRFERLSLSIRNASLEQGAFQPGVAFFDIKAPPGNEVQLLDLNTAETPSVGIELQSCVLRGEADVLRSDELQPVRFVWRNGFLATSGRLLHADGGPMSPRSVGQVRVELEHVTAVIRSGLALLTSHEDTPYQLATEIQCLDSILVAGPGAALIEQRSPDRVEDCRTRLQWLSNAVCYQEVGVFWRIGSPASSQPAQEWGLVDWQSYWGASRETRPRLNAVMWRTAPPVRPYSLQLPGDYSLAATGDNPARAGAGDGHDVGCQLGLLPSLPPEPRSAQLPR